MKTVVIRSNHPHKKTKEFKLRTLNTQQIIGTHINQLLKEFPETTNIIIEIY